MTEKRNGIVASVICGVTLCSGPVLANMNMGEKCFEQYRTLEANYDPQIVSMFSDHAAIVQHGMWPTGKPKNTRLPVAAFKQTMLAELQADKANSVQYSYSGISSVAEEGGYRVRGKEIISGGEIISISMLIRPDAKGRCRIEEFLTNNEQN